MSHGAGSGVRRCGLSLLILVTLAACSPGTAGPQLTPSAVAAAPTAILGPEALPAVPSGALRGLSIKVWYPWLGVEASLFESLVTEFNNNNDWGISVQATSESSYTEIYNNVTSSLPTADRPQLVVALPEYALAWDTDGYVVDLTGYIADPANGLNSDDVRDFPAVFWSQDAVGGRRLGVPAERA